MERELSPISLFPIQKLLLFIWENDFELTELK